MTSSSPIKACQNGSRGEHLRKRNKIGDLIRKYSDQVVLGELHCSKLRFQGERISSAAPSFINLVTSLKWPGTTLRHLLSNALLQRRIAPGRLGILAAEMERSKGAIPRWAPMFFPYEGDAHAKSSW